MGSSIQAEDNILTAQELKILSNKYVQSILSDYSDDGNDIVLQQLKNGAGWLQAWEAQHGDIVNYICESTTHEEQKIALRKKTLALVEKCSITQPFLREGLTDEEVDLLLKHRHPDLSLEDAKMVQFEVYIFSETSLRCLRKISAQFADANKDDWFDLSVNIHRQHISHLYRKTVAHLTGETYNFESLVDVLQKMIDEVENKILDGKPWDFTKKLRDVRQFEELQKQNLA
ncbi:MAG: hypothetical protein HQL69_02765 [Magnetococcales bacterium]|nr:hypothetical protein [Magnetococcales bacterium]